MECNSRAPALEVIRDYIASLRSKSYMDKSISLTRTDFTGLISQITWIFYFLAHLSFRRPTLVGKALSFTHEFSFFFFFINPLCSAATQKTTIKCISKVRS